MFMDVILRLSDFCCLSGNRNTDIQSAMSIKITIMTTLYIHQRASSSNITKCCSRSLCTIRHPYTFLHPLLLVQNPNAAVHWLIPLRISEPPPPPPSHQPPGTHQSVRQGFELRHQNRMRHQQNLEELWQLRHPRWASAVSADCLRPPRWAAPIKYKTRDVLTRPVLFRKGLKGANYLSGYLLFLGLFADWTDVIGLELRGSKRRHTPLRSRCPPWRGMEDHDS